MSIPISSSGPERDLVVFIHAASVAEWSLPEKSKVVTYIRSVLGASATLRECAAVIFAAAQSPAIQEVYFDGKGRPRNHWPLRAAKHLLGLGNYSQDVHAEVEDLGWSLHKMCTDGDQIVNKQPLSSPSLRHRMATIAGGYGTSRNITTHESRIAKSLLKAIDDVLQSQDRDSLIGAVLLQMVEAERRTEVREDTGEDDNRERSVEGADLSSLHPLFVVETIAPMGRTFQLWEEAGADFDCFLMWADIFPADADLFLVRDAKARIVRDSDLYKSPRIRVLAEKFEKEIECSNNRSPVPILVAIQRRLEELLRNESDEYPKAIGLAQAVFLGRLILDVRKYSTSSARCRRNIPSSPHFQNISAGWSDAAIMRSYNYWILEIGKSIVSGDVDWNPRGQMGEDIGTRSDDYYKNVNVVDIANDLATVSREGLAFYVPGISASTPALSTAMYWCSYSPLNGSSYRAFLHESLHLVPEHRAWLSSFLELGSLVADVSSMGFLPDSEKSPLRGSSDRAYAARIIRARMLLASRGNPMESMLPKPLRELSVQIRISAGVGHLLDSPA